MMRINKTDLKEMLGLCNELKSMSLLEQCNLQYRIIEGEEYQEEVLNQLKRIKNDTQIVGTPERTVVWEQGWSENLHYFRESLDVRDLQPRYFKNKQPYRFKGKFIKSENYDFQYQLESVFKKCLFEQYAFGCENIYEFGCGTGINLINLGDLYPEKNLYGYDLTNSSVAILDLLREKLGYRVVGGTFDFTQPDETVKIKPSSVVFTLAALEQIGGRIHKFVDFLIQNKVERCVHVEPIVEAYDEDNLLDWMAKEFHMKRNYLHGLLPYLEEKQNSGVIHIDKVHRPHFGDCNHEGYTVIVWHVV